MSFQSKFLLSRVFTLFSVLLLCCHQLDITECDSISSPITCSATTFESALGDSGMKDQRVRVALESWDFCNKVGSEGPDLPSPRQADCADIRCSAETGRCLAFQHVTAKDNMLKAGEAFPEGSSLQAFHDPDKYAIQKELYLAKLCQVRNPHSKPWNFWMIMLKNGNFDKKLGLCPSTFTPTSSSSFERPAPLKGRVSKATFPCFGEGCMNQPRVYHNWSMLQRSTCSYLSSDISCTSNDLAGGFYGTYDLDHNIQLGSDAQSSFSYFSVTWEKNRHSGSWDFHHVLKVTKKYPWLMLYLRTDATRGESGGYPYETRGMMTEVPESPNFKVILTLNVIKGGGPQSQFYLLDMGGCWKNNGEQCDGDITADVTRYSEMIINPEVDSRCSASDYSQCPPYHIAANGNKIFRNDTAHFPYSAYHLYCVPPNAKFAEQPFHYCDPYSNPQPQELMQLLPHPEWAVYGYPAKKGEGWMGDARTWELDVGGLSSRLYFYQDPGTPPARRLWPSLDVGTEIYISSQDEVAEWSVSNFDVLVPKCK